MYRIDVYKRKPDGNRGILLFSSRYETKEQAEKAKTALIKNSRGSTVAPRDIECCGSEKEVTKVINYNLLYSDNEKLVLKSCTKEKKAITNPAEFVLWKLKSYIVADPIQEQAIYSNKHMLNF